MAVTYKANVYYKEGVTSFVIPFDYLKKTFEYLKMDVYVLIVN